MSFPTTPQNAGSFPNCKNNIQWFWSLAAEVSAPRTAGRLKASLSFIVEDLRQDLRAVTKKCRPDWDITTPELKAAWQKGRKELFYPYGKARSWSW
jgi:hypothetical protein